MEEAQLETSRPSEILMAFPLYRRSHLKSETFGTLVRILSHCSNGSHLPSANEIDSASQEVRNHDKGSDRLGQESLEKEHEHLQFTGPDFMNLKDPVSHKETQVPQTFGDREFTGEFVMGVEGDEGSSGRQDMMICESERVEALPREANGLNKEQKKIEELNKLKEGTEKLVGNGLTPLNLALGESQNGSSEFELMDYQVEDVEFRGPDIKTSRTESGLNVEGEFNQNIFEDFDASLIANISTSAMEQTTTPLISMSSIEDERQQKEMELVKTVCAAMVSLPTTEEGEFEKNEHDQKVHEAMALSVDDGMKSSESLNLSINLKGQQKEVELVNPVSAAIDSLPATGEGEFEKEEQHSQKVPEAKQFSVDHGMNIETSNSSIKHDKQQKEIEPVKIVCTAMVSLPTTKEGEFEKEEQHGQKVPEAVHVSVDQVNEALISSIEPERQQKEMELVKPANNAIVSLPNTEEAELGKEEQYCQKVHEAINLSVDQGTNGETLNLSKYSEEKSLMDIDILEAKHVMRHEEEQPEKIICANDATTFSSHPDKEGDIEEGEISGDFRMDEDSLDISSADSLMTEQRKDDVQKPRHVIENIVFPFNIRSGVKEENYALPQDACNSGPVKPRISDKNRFPIGVDQGISPEIFNYGDLVQHSSVLVTRKGEDRDSGIKGAVDLPPVLASNKVLDKLFMKEEAAEDHQNTSAVKTAMVDYLQQKAGINGKKKRGPVTEEKKAKKKEKKRKKRAEKNRKLGVKRLKLQPVQRPKTITYCRHYLMGRCHEGDQCKFSHDIVPLTKSKPCCHFARHSCMKGDDCPFDHELSKYPCSNFVTRGSCSRGDACLFSHQMPTKEDVPPSSNDGKPELKPQLPLGNMKLSKPPNISGGSASKQKEISDSKGIQSHVNSENEVADTVKKPPTLAPKGISFINVSKSSSPKQGMVTPNKESAVQIGTLSDQSASRTALNSQNPQKTPMVTPKGINFLSFGKGRVSSFKSPICSFLNKESGIKLSHKENLGTLEQSSLNKGDCSEVGRRTKQGVLKAALCSKEIQQNQSVAEGTNLDFRGKTSIDHDSNDVQSSLNSHRDHNLSRSSVQEQVKAYTPQISTVTSSMLATNPFLPGQSSERLASGHHNHIFNSSQRGLLSTLSFAVEHESSIKLKCPAGSSAIKLEMNKKNVSNSSS